MSELLISTKKKDWNSLILASLTYELANAL